MTPASRNPAWDPAAHARVRRELSALLDTMRSLTQHNTDENGEYWETDETLGGDITGVTNAARVGLIEPLERQIASVRATITEVLDQAEEYKRRRYGPGYRPVTGGP